VISAIWISAILKPGRLSCDVCVKCVSDTKAISILLFCRMASNSSLWFVRPFDFQVRMRVDFEIILLVSIFIRNDTLSKSSETRNKRVYD